MTLTNEKMQESIKVSIITINLNNSRGLKKTISSVINQSFNNYEFLIIDGGSKDDSIEVIIENKEKITYWLSEPDSGIYNAMNKGIKKAKGEFCFFLNSGDYLYSNDTLEKVFTSYTDSEILYGDVILSSIGKKAIQRHPDNLSFFDFYTGGICHQSAFIKRSLFQKYGYYNESFKIVSDWEFFLNTIILSTTTVKHKSQIISVFDMNGVGYRNHALMESERNLILNEKIPSLILSDYKKFRNHKKDIEILGNIKKSGFLYLLYRLLGKASLLSSKCSR
jgi:glycosyltransferase involved in cell wall biosynthesis